MNIFISIIMVIVLSPVPHAATLSTDGQAEITHLLDFLEASGCEFYRNGSWHKAEAARAHLEEKYRYLLKKLQIRNAEDFIAMAATKSSMSGEAYQVRCGKRITPSAAWLTAELTRLRQKQSASQSGVHNDHTK